MTHSRPRPRSNPRSSRSTSPRSRSSRPAPSTPSPKELRVQEFRDRVEVRLTSPRHTSVEAHLGPTNSGKTHDALALLVAEGQGTFAAPLRMLAMEAQAKLSALLGAENVGLLTGEEIVNPDAPVICCTTEMAPRRGRVLVLDEVQWLSDPERGWAWTHLMLESTYDHVRLCGGAEALPVLQAIYGSDLVVHSHERLLPLSFAGDTTLSSLPDRSVVVAFARKGVIALARELSELRGEDVALLYGAMPPDVRRREIARFASGEVSCMVSSDVIGHGVNLPADNVVFASTEKFDGTRLRTLFPGEIAQIAGRAGRFGLASEGRVYTLRGREGFTPSSSLVQSVLTRPHPVASTLPGRIRPSLASLHVEDVFDFPPALLAWHQRAKELTHAEKHLRPHDVTPLLERFAALAAFPRALSRQSLQDVWSFLTMPVDKDDVPVLARVFLRGDDPSARLYLDVASSLEESEQVAAWARNLAAFTLAFPTRSSLTHEEARAAEEAASTHIATILASSVEDSTYGICASCGRPSAPWFNLCERCHSWRW